MAAVCLYMQLSALVLVAHQDQLYAQPLSVLHALPAYCITATLQASLDTCLPSGL